MKDNKLNLNMQLFADGVGSEMQNAECRMQNEEDNQVRSAKCGMRSAKL